MLAVMPNWLYERGAPTDALRFEEPLAALKKRIAAGDDVFEDILRRRIVQNGHLATVEMKPDPEMAAREKKAEEDSLAAAKAGMREANPHPSPLIRSPIPIPNPGPRPTKAGMREANPNPSPRL